MESKLLSLAFFVLAPLIPMLLILSPFFPNNSVIIRRFAKWFQGFHFIYSLCFLLYFNPNLLSMSFNQEIILFNISWLKTLGISATFAVDGLSLLLCVLTSFIFLIALIISKYSIHSKYKLYYSLIFLLQTSILGVFCAKDIFLFFLFWELELIPMYFLISLWGNKNATKSATKYLMYSVIGNAFLLFSLLILYCYNFALSGVLTANIDALSFDEYVNPIIFQIIVFTGFFIGFATKFPIFPFHTWLADVHANAPTPVNIILSSVILNMGTFGLIRFNMQIFPTAFKTVAIILMILSVINIVYGAIVAFAQTNIKKLLAYANFSQMGFILLGLTTITVIGFTGALFQIFAHSLVFAGLFLIAGIVYQRTQSDDINELGGIARKMQKLMHFVVLISLAAIGVPFLIGFPSILMVLIGTFTTELYEQIIFQICTIIVIISLLAFAICILKFLHKVFFANMLSKFDKIQDLSLQEFFVLLMLILPITIFGVAPMLLINFYNNLILVLMDILRV